MSENDVKEAFDAYRAEPGGEVRLDTASITTAGRRRVQRNRVLLGVGGFVVAAALVGAAIPFVSGGDDQSVTVAGNPDNLPPATGRDVNTLFTDARGWQKDAKAQTGGVARNTAAGFLGKLDAPAPANADLAWLPSMDDAKKPGGQFALLTWVEGGKAAEGLLSIQASPIYTAIFPPSYQVCPSSPKAGTTCSVRKVDGKGWLKEVRSTENGQQTLRVSLQRDDGPAVDFVLSQGAATSAGLAKGMKPVGKFLIDPEQITKAVLETR